EPLAALVAQRPRPPLPAALPPQRAPVAGPLQGLPDRARRAPADRAALRGAQRPTRRPGGACRGVAVVEPALVGGREAPGLRRRGSGAAPGGPDGLRE